MEFIAVIIVVYVLYLIFKNKDENVTSPSKSEDRYSYDYEIYRSSSPKVAKSKNTSKGKWIKDNEEIEVGDKSIKRGLFYFGGVMDSSYRGEGESSLIDDTLPIKTVGYQFTDDSLGYWPRFSSISPECRGAYIDWLASNRDMSDVPIGYLFIYFYGLERRIVKDHKDGIVSKEECIEICNEILRLKSIFSSNYSFLSYSSRLLEYIAITSPDILFIPDIDIRDSIGSNLFRHKLANIVMDEKKLNPELAYAWIRDHPDHNLRTPARRCLEEFQILFIKKYKDKYGEGITIKPNKTKLQLNYNPASNSIEYFSYGASDLCDPSVLSGPIKKIAKIALECTDELDAYSRYLGKKGNSKEDIDAIVLLPCDIITEFDISLIKEFKDWAKNISLNKEGICDFKDFWLQTKLPLPAKVNKREQELVCNLIDKSGYSFAPHPILHGSKLNADGYIVIYERDTTVKLENSAVFDDVAVKLRLASIIVNADLNINSNEVSFLQNIIHSNDNLTVQEKLSLDAYSKWLLKSPSNFNGLKASLSKLRDKDNGVVRKMLINVALSDGNIASSEIKQIEKLYTTLGLDKSTVPADIHALSSSKGRFATDHTTMSHSSKSNVPFKLDDNVIKLHEAETRDAHSILNEIFKDEEDHHDPILNQEVELTLEDKALAIYKLISDNDNVDRSDFEKICLEHGFFVDSAIDSINEWAFDKVNAPVIEDDIDIIIDREIANELKEIEGI